MTVKAYYHRYGMLDCDEYDTVEEAKSVMEHQEDMGECFADCIVDENEIIIYDFDTDKYILGREKPKTRTGTKFGTK